MRPTLGIVLGLAAVSPGQITAEVVAVTDLVCSRISSRTGGNKLQSIAKNTKLTSPVLLNAGALMDSSWSVGTSFDYRCHALSSGYRDTGSFHSESAKGSVLIWLRSKRPVHGTLTIGISTIRTGEGLISGQVSGQVFPAVDYVAGSSMKTFRVTIDSAGLQIGHRLDHLSVASLQNPRASTNSGLLIVFRPGSHFDTYGKGCGPSLSGRFLDSANMELNATGLPPGPSGFSGLFFGIRATSISIPGTNCLVLTEYLLGIRLANTSQGAARVVIPIPSAWYGVRAQIVGVDPIRSVLSFSNGLQVRK